jgi:hypothetical protein
MIKYFFVATVTFSLFGCGGGGNSDDPIADDGFNDPSCVDHSLGFENTGAEDVDPTTSNDQFGVLTSWNPIVGNTSSTLYDQGDYPVASDGQGSRLFTGGNIQFSQAVQSKTLSADVVGCNFVFSAEIGGYLTQEDNATVELLFLASSGDVLSTTTLGPVNSQERQGASILLPVEANGTVPEAAVQAQLIISQNRLAGVANDGYVDNIDVTLN